MELFHIDLTILISVSQIDQSSKLVFSESYIQYCKDHFEFHVRENSIAICIKARKHLLDIDALLLKFGFESIS